MVFMCFLCDSKPFNSALLFIRSLLSALRKYFLLGTEQPAKTIYISFLVNVIVFWMLKLKVNFFPWEFDRATG